MTVIGVRSYDAAPSQGNRSPLPAVDHPLISRCTQQYYRLLFTSMYVYVRVSGFSLIVSGLAVQQGSGREDGLQDALDAVHADPRRERRRHRRGTSHQQTEHCRRTVQREG